MLLLRVLLYKKSGKISSKLTMLGRKFTAISYFIIGIIIICLNVKELESSKWIKHMIRDIEKNNPQQALLICNCDDKGERFSEIMISFGESIPNIIIDYQNLTNNGYAKMITNNPRSTTLFIIIECFKEAFNTSRTFETAKVIKEVTSSKMRPKCLVIHLYETKHVSGYENLLRKAWSYLFLDFSIIEVYSSQMTKDAKEIQILHYFNPFSDKCLKQRFLSILQLFPKKLHDLKGYELKVGTYHRPSYSFVKRNSSGYPTENYGTDASILQIFANIVNFKIILVPSFKEEFGIFDCDKRKATGFGYDVLHNLIQLINLRSVHVSFACGHEANDIILFGLTHYSAVVPITRVTGRSFWLGHNFIVTTIATLIIGILMFLIAKLFEFEKTIWMYTNTIRAILGQTIPQQPLELKERIVYGTVFLISIFYTTSIFSALTDVHFQKEVEVAVSSLKDLSESNLEIIVPNNSFNLILKSGDTAVVNMLKMNKKFHGSPYEEICLNLLVRNKQVACIGRQTVIQKWIDKHPDSSGRPIMKLIPQTLYTTAEGYVMEPGSPYVEKFNELMSNLHQSGIYSKLQSDYDRDSIKECVKACNESGALTIHLMLWLLILGYSISIVVFVIEYFQANRKSRFGF